ncbi:hypothetical protein N474_18385 [Pseudoalteromonas luteoviolacea CPMOR-2]|uniref:Uncharacterized protein n=1 Tax=Pseudoalteromonas luteoviolacea DSM 6061 TaxID=1365250 RepID=A0A166VEQ1_9GAMM|nr:hypothetical protein [Pseudoalteromonas luteoviolacea]KZN32577.1 hypothetical protein N475_21865 [Pseudoalteromonas luteoviolacea DSM 6061]KZN54016.1 hypothetical protein N474_18385 [Pseudoalteromonas luteoviolacea CPMOR-2]MBE0387183.1 hypothetical protein [Pseudoalteromonas luteoviolacea DSM 6061]
MRPINNRIKELTLRYEQENSFIRREAKDGNQIFKLVVCNLVNGTWLRSSVGQVSSLGALNSICKFSVLKTTHIDFQMAV